MYGILLSHLLWTGAPSCYLELLDKLQNGYARLALATSLEPLAHRRNVATLSLFCRYYFCKCSSKLVQLVPLPFSRGRSTRYSDNIPICLNLFMLLFLVTPCLVVAVHPCME